MTKLYYSPASPFARSCRILIREKDAAAKIEEINTHPFESSDALMRANPTSKVPALELDSGVFLTETAIICACLEETLDGPELAGTPASRPEVWARAGLAFGVMDATVRLTQERRREAHQQFDYWIERWERAISLGLARLEETALADNAVDLGVIATVCAGDYLDFRHPGMGWRSDHPRLAAASAALSDRTSFADTAPHD